MANRVRNAEYTKQYNRKLIINILTKGPVSRAELARATGLTRAAVSIIADELILRGTIVETEAVLASRGRSPIPLALNPNAFYAVGIYLNRELCHVGLVDILGNCIEVCPVTFHKMTSVNDAMGEISKIIKKILEHHPEAAQNLTGIGISAPGPLDVKKGMILCPPGFEFWHNAEICRGIEKYTNIKTLLDDNADALAAFNKRYGSVKDCDDFLLLLVDSGVGSGIITKGSLHRGANGMSSEIGHISINHTGKECRCGNIGCLERYAAIPNLLKDEGVSYKHFFEAAEDAKKGSRIAIDLISKEADYLSAGITNVVNLFDLETIVLAGDILDAYPIIAPILKEKVSKHILSKERHQIKILPSNTKEHFNIVSAANIVFDNFLE